MKQWAVEGKWAGWRSADLVIAVVVLSVMMAGCIPSYGKFVSNPGIHDRYQTRALSDIYHYYFSGRPGLPDAVVGIDDSYRLRGRLWFKIESMDQVYEKIENLSNLNPDATILRTADILDHQGKKIGVWFSYFFYAPVKVDPETQVVEILDPDIFTGSYGRSGP